MLFDSKIIRLQFLWCRVMDAENRIPLSLIPL